MPIKKAIVWIQDAHGKTCYFKTVTAIEHQQMSIDFINQIPENYFIRILANDSILYGRSFLLHK